MTRLTNAIATVMMMTDQAPIPKEDPMTYADRIAARRLEALQAPTKTVAERRARRDLLRERLETIGLSAVQTAELHLLEEACDADRLWVVEPGIKQAGRQLYLIRNVDTGQQRVYKTEAGAQREADKRNAS